MRKYNCIDYGVFGQRIAKRRADMGWSQKELAEKVDCNESYISKIERGKATPTLSLTFLIAQELNVGIDYFLPSTSAGSKLFKSEVSEKLDQCSPELLLFLNSILEEAQQWESRILHKKGNPPT